ncbi:MULTISPECIES: hypothetical protein [Bradyrhizobium]|uniref:CopG family transcriptional regulator n=1 Tax=Bradyrhizobium ottawaense TaxID=931866 RepID=A0ABV4FP58_9BRAD|nr:MULTISPECIES: hypothetical protein [Bradyrhizobium]MBR1292878.1 hypothetical protein [Bradyrhizobium ottawaense]WLB45994.1 hypothetical protein QIH93_36905 [Bradyrhizobium ottawaense]GMO15856.1 hypothetical protein BwSH14_05550 [Bradyrhizobium ottawaense]GMO19064.1 hypothetical protein BwSF21_11840 [Bradyrhizobium ottawaense]GMO44852.1 hypothetical protein BwSF12_49730 [Bradyrhizobium ottawaense]
MAKAAKTTKAGATKSAVPTESTRTDGRKALLVYIQPDLILAAKDVAADNGENLFAFVERTLAKALGWKKPRGSKRWVP